MGQVSELRVNGKRVRIDGAAGTSLLSALRDQLGLTGAKYGCGEGQCGACTVLIDGKAARSCVTTLQKVSGKSVTTIEGLAAHPIQDALLEFDALQCGYCTPGMVMSCVSLLRENPHPGEAEIVRSLNGNVCRCGTYPRIVAAVRSLR
jgi:aerobic-type carbon monoxide dehydrogenase small subunit (CoxS/CutS family)